MKKNHKSEFIYFNKEESSDDFTFSRMYDLSLLLF